ncbi:MAG: glycosyl hydrolase [Saprospiraceae bacterium]|nr:glycosyl hydrolase [Candidatus Vicinibacter affinis]
MHKFFFPLILLLFGFSMQSQNIFNPFEKYYSAIEWRHIGPFRGGRSCAVTGLVNQPNTYIMGSTGGGVWKTSDSGKTWKNISDSYFGGSIGAVAISESDPNILFAGTGEETVRGNVSSGEGVWRSEDGGKTWVFSGLKNTRHISRIRIHPKNANLVYLAAMGDLYKPNSDRGIYKSIDGGKNWKKVLFVNDSAGAVDLIFDPSLPRIMYATTWKVQRSPYSLESGGKGSSMWKSTDGGETWREIRQNKGLPEGIWGISCITICPTLPDRLYAMIENENGGLFRSDDGGDSWEKINESRDLRQRAWYFSRLQADPLDPNTVYVLNVSFHKSTDGGKSFKTISTQHGDNHDIWINPQNPSNLIVGNDGGAQISMNSGSNWSSVQNQPTAQFYRLTVDNSFPFRIYAAQQDNSTVRISHRTSGNKIGNEDWESTAGGESGHIAVDPDNPDIVYGGSYGGYLTRYDHKNNLSRNIHVWPDNPIGYGAENLKYRFQWNFPILFSRHKPKKLFTASNHLHVSYNEGQSWETISPDLTRNDPSKLKPSGGPITKDNTSVEYYCTIFAIAESVKKEDLIWVGSDDGLVHLTMDGGKLWTNVTPKDLPSWCMINSIEADPFNAAGAYIAATSYKSGDYRPYLYKTEDYGKNWKKIISGIDDEHFTRALRADPVTKGLLYCGTERAMYVSFDDGMKWYNFQMNLPKVPITDLLIKDYSLIAATQGRSLWMIDDLTPLRNIQEKQTQKKYLLPPKPAYRMSGGMDKSIVNAGINHPSQLMLYNYLDSFNLKDSVEIKLLSTKGELVTQLSTFHKDKKYRIELKSGANLILVPFTMESAKSVDGMIMWGASLDGPLAPPGKYKIVYKSKNYIDSIDCQIIRDLRYPATDQDVVRLYNFIMKLRNKVDESHKTILNIRDVRKQLSEFAAKIEKNDKSTTFFKLKSQIDSTLNSIENELYQTKMQSVQDPINFPIKLTNKLAHLIALYNGSSYPPTNQAEELAMVLTDMIDQQILYFKNLQNNELKEINQLIRKSEWDVISPSKFE